jgi:hypothetical protein
MLFDDVDEESTDAGTATEPKDDEETETTEGM